MPGRLERTQTHSNISSEYEGKEREDEDRINGNFFRGRLAVEYADLEILKKISDMVNKL